MPYPRRACLCSRGGSWPSEFSKNLSNETRRILESSGAVSASFPAQRRQLSPDLASQVSSVTWGKQPPGGAAGGRARCNSRTDAVEELQSVFNLFDRNGNTEWWSAGLNLNPEA